jgi:hypothetical protein
LLKCTEKQQLRPKDLYIRRAIKTADDSFTTPRRRQSKIASARDIKKEVIGLVSSRRHRRTCHIEEALPI